MLNGLILFMSVVYKNIQRINFIYSDSSSIILIHITNKITMSAIKPYTQRLQPSLPKLSPPHKLQYSNQRLRSQTNYQMHTKYTENNTEQRDDTKLRKHSQSYAVIKANNQGNTNTNGKTNLSGQTKQLKLYKAESKQYASSINTQSRNKNTKSVIGNANSSQNSRQLRSKLLSMHVLQPYETTQTKSNPYDKFIKQLNISLPTPQQKFNQFLQIAPFNRLKNHTDFISHILQKCTVFFHMHPSQVVDNIAKKILLIPPEQIPQNYLIVLDEGNCYYNKKKIQKGCLITRNKFDPDLFSYEGPINLIGLPHHQYSLFVTQYLNANMSKFKKFMESIQIFKIFTQQAMEKIYASLTLNFYSKGQTIYEPGHPADMLYLIYSGSAARKIIVQIDKTNKIPIQKFSKLVKVLSRSYQHRIRFKQQDLVGVADIIDNIHKRSQDIITDQDTTILTIDRIAIQQNLDQYIIDRLRKYNLRKYPKNYDELCDNYLKQKVENRKAQQRKITALKDEMNRDTHNQRKNQKISGIIKIYQKRIKQQEKEHLIDRRKMERIVHSDS